MANRRSPETKLSDAILSNILIQQKQFCALCKIVLERKLMVADHIVPMRAGGDDIPENIQFICPECDVTRKYTIRVPRGLADAVLHESHISFTEIVRIAFVKYLEGQQDVIVANPPYSDNSELMRLRKQNSIMGQRIKMIEGALNWNPYSNYIDTDYIKDGM